MRCTVLQTLGRSCRLNTVFFNDQWHRGSLRASHGARARDHQEGPQTTHKSQNLPCVIRSWVIPECFRVNNFYWISVIISRAPSLIIAECGLLPSGGGGRLPAIYATVNDIASLRTINITKFCGSLHGYYCQVGKLCPEALRWTEWERHSNS